MNIFKLKPEKRGNAVVLHKRNRFAIVKDLKDKTYVYFVYNNFIEDYSYIEMKKKSYILSPLILYICYWILTFLYGLSFLIFTPVLYFIGGWNFIRKSNYQDGVYLFGLVNFGIVIAVIIKEVIYHIILKK